MAFLVVVIDVPGLAIGTLNDQCQFPTKSYESIQGVANLIAGIEAGAYDASVQLTTRDNDPAVSTHGSGSQQYTYNLK